MYIYIVFVCWMNKFIYSTPQASKHQKRTVQSGKVWIDKGFLMPLRTAADRFFLFRYQLFFSVQGSGRRASCSTGQCCCSQQRNEKLQKPWWLPKGMVDINDVPVPYGIHILRMIRLSQMIHISASSFFWGLNDVSRWPKLMPCGNWKRRQGFKWMSVRKSDPDFRADTSPDVNFVHSLSHCIDHHDQTPAPEKQVFKLKIAMTLRQTNAHIMAYWLYRCFFDACQEREMQEATQQVFNDFLERSLEVLPRLLLRTLQIWVYQILRCEVWVEFLLSQNRSNFLEVQPLQEGGRKLKLFEETPEGWEKQPIRGNRLKVLVLGHKILTKRPGREYLATRARSYRERWWMGKHGKAILVVSPVKF